VQLFAPKKARQNRPQRPHHARQHWCARVACHNVRPTTTIPERACEDMARTPWPSRVTCHHRGSHVAWVLVEGAAGSFKASADGRCAAGTMLAVRSLDAIACVFATSRLQPCPSTVLRDCSRCGVWHTSLRSRGRTWGAGFEVRGNRQDCAVMCAATCARRALPCAGVGGAGWCVCPRCRPLGARASPVRRAGAVFECVHVATRAVLAVKLL
jgi:hypothetical protein